MVKTTSCSIFSEIPSNSPLKLGLKMVSPHCAIFSENYPSAYPVATWWLIQLSKWVITPVINGISRVNPLITGVTTHLLSEMSHQVPSGEQPHFAMERSTHFSWENPHDFDWAIFNCELLVHQRVENSPSAMVGEIFPGICRRSQRSVQSNIACFTWLGTWQCDKYANPRGEKDHTSTLNKERVNRFCVFFFMVVSH